MGYLLVGIILLILLLIYAYMREFAIHYSIIKKILFCVTIIAFTLAVILYPGDSFNAALDGLNIWFNIVFPSLLPFFIGSELLINLGIVSFIGTLLEPIMRPIFNTPGCGSFPFIMSITSGYPMGSKIVAQLYSNKMCNKSEAQRLLSFCSTSGPLFIIGAVAIGMLKMGEYGTLIILSHYLGALSVGIIFRYYKYKDRTTVLPQSGNMKRALTNLKHTLVNENRPIGQLLSESVRNSVNSLLLIGGFIVLFSVVIRLLLNGGIIELISRLLYKLLSPLGVDKSVLNSTTAGIFEMTIGCKLIASSQAIIISKVLAICAIISWSGFSVHAQVAAMISTTDLNLNVYILCKVLHSLFSCIYAYVLLSVWNINGIGQTLSVFSYNLLKENNTSWISRLAISSSRFTGTLIFIFAAAIIYILFKRIVSFINR